MASRRKSTGLTNRDLGISGGSGKGSATRVRSSEKFAKNYASINWGPKPQAAAFIVDLDGDCQCDSYFTDLRTGKTTKRGGGKVPKSVLDEAKRFCNAAIKMIEGGKFPENAGETKRSV